MPRFDRQDRKFRFAAKAALMEKETAVLPFISTLLGWRRVVRTGTEHTKRPRLNLETVPKGKRTRTRHAGRLTKDAISLLNRWSIRAP